MAARFGNNDRLCNALGNAVQGLHGVANPFAVVAAGQEPAEGWAERTSRISGSALDSFRVLAVRGPRRVASEGVPDGVLAIASPVRRDPMLGAAQKHPVFRVAGQLASLTPCEFAVWSTTSILRPSQSASRMGRFVASRLSSARTGAQTTSATIASTSRRGCLRCAYRMDKPPRWSLPFQASKVGN